MRIRRWRESILKAGHEIGHHGYHHLLPDPGDPWIEEELERGFEALKRRLGVKPTGYRAPYGEFTEELRVALVRHGIVYTVLVPRRRATVSPSSRRRQARHDRAAGDRKLRRLDARTVRPFQPAPDLPEGACALDVEGRARRGPRLGRDGDDRAASAMQRPSDAASAPARISNLRADPARICGLRPARRSRQFQRYEAAPLRPAD